MFYRCRTKAHGESHWLQGHQEEERRRGIKEGHSLEQECSISPPVIKRVVGGVSHFTGARGETMQQQCIAMLGPSAATLMKSSGATKRESRLELRARVRFISNMYICLLCSVVFFLPGSSRMLEHCHCAGRGRIVRVRRTEVLHEHAAPVALCVHACRGVRGAHPCYGVRRTRVSCGARRCGSLSSTLVR